MAIVKLFGLLLCALLVKGNLNSNVQILENLSSTAFGRIILGYPAANGQFPHQVHLRLETASGSQTTCGGSIISTRHILTAAHCLSGRAVVYVRMGTNNLATGTVVESRQFVIHPQFNPDQLYNDVGVITLPSEIQETNTIKVIQLPRLSDAGQLYDGQLALVSGWGSTTDTGSISTTLNYVELRVITNARCRDYYIPSLIIDSTLCCSGNTLPIQGTCYGDSGGALFLKDSEGVNTQIGVVSFVSSISCSAGIPSGYARVTSFLNWISEVSGIPLRP